MRSRRSVPGATPTVDQLDAALGMASPDLDEVDRAIAETVYRRLARGNPVTSAEISRTSGQDLEKIDQRLAAWPGVFTDDSEPERVIGFWGLAISEMPHRFTVNGTELFTWCAWDPLFIARIVGPAEVATTDPVNGDEIRYGVDGAGTITALSHPDSVLSFLEPSEHWDDDVQTSFCHYVVHFSNMETGERWCAEHSGTFLLDLDQAAELAARHAARVAGVGSLAVVGRGRPARQSAERAAESRPASSFIGAGRPRCQP